MQHAAYLFLDRAWEKDQVTIKNLMGYYKSCQSPLSVRIEVGAVYLSIRIRCRCKLFNALLLFIE